MFAEIMVLGGGKMVDYGIVSQVEGERYERLGKERPSLEVIVRYHNHDIPEGEQLKRGCDCE